MHSRNQGGPHKIYYRAVWLPDSTQVWMLSPDVRTKEVHADNDLHVLQHKYGGGKGGIARVRAPNPMAAKKLLVYGKTDMPTTNVWGGEETKRER